ncbi:hypothetical protein HanRHA438_Chr17g0821601 [Helianthus annuus]|uniref:Uncharacterized protein n=1 Tax=Helianthus annuus TaxID=4232 RepID=A0A251RSG4_HELAN|nr:hypothetical protein HanXRQr2_Chr17g0811531 [Helianthus annuus]KAJ0448163.1 hypothetical protein HanHA89_Chr17g0713661 [Helianthus annuus]KAJ0633049.1 hypothetical protein HanLR1_Chr17g0672161 [Helianthus annuus]KAJ0827079.1 hypothetical protein HanRHA438_Chr17g0821601 [Helianthus annuus]
MGERTAAHGGGGDEVRRRRRRSQTTETAGSETRTNSLCLGPVVCVSDRWSVRLSGGPCLYPTSHPISGSETKGGSGQI